VATPRSNARSSKATFIGVLAALAHATPLAAIKRARPVAEGSAVSRLEVRDPSNGERESFAEKRRDSYEPSFLRGELWLMNEIVNSFGRVLALVGALFVLAVLVTGVGLWRVEASLDQDKAKVLALTEEFAACLYREDLVCLSTLSTWDEQALSRGLEQAKLVQARLGARGKSAPIPSSWSMRKFNSLTSGLTIMTRVSLAAIYECDTKAWERVEVVEHKGTLRVRSFRVNSSKVVEVSQLTP
jgi:hypothetical protein